MPEEGTRNETGVVQGLVQLRYKDYIYVDKLGHRVKPGYITQHFKLVLKKHGLRHIRFHVLRQSYASLFLANSVSLKEIQEWLGYSHYSTTANIFARLDFSSKLSSAQVITIRSSDFKHSKKLINRISAIHELNID